MSFSVDEGVLRVAGLHDIDDQGGTAVQEGE
jgi:hypothetical protein